MPSRSQSTCSKGLSLAEVLVVMALLLVVTGLMAGLVREYSDIMRFGNAKVNSLEVAQAALGRMASEATEACRLDLSQNDRLKLKRLDPSPAALALRFPATGPAADNWQPFEPLVEVIYGRAAGDLLFRSAGGQNLEIASGISGLQVKAAANGGLDITISAQESRRVVTISTHVYLPASLMP